MTPLTFGARLAFAINQSGLSIEQVAQQLFVPVSALRHELQGQGQLAELLVAEQLGRLCPLLGVSWAWLVEGVPTPKATATARRMRASATRTGMLQGADLDTLCHLLEAIG